MHEKGLVELLTNMCAAIKKILIYTQKVAAQLSARLEKHTQFT